jgi:hypothetical protein
MSVLNTIDITINPLLKGNYVYDDHHLQWRYLLISYLGGSEYKEAGYLSRYLNETESEYKRRLEVTPLDNHCKSVVSVYNSFLFREEPERDYGSLLNTPELESFLKDVDYEGRDIDSFMKEVATWTTTFGHAWIMVSKPNIGALTRQDEISNEIRPYLSLLTPLTVLDWSFSRTQSGRYSLDYLRYIEEINGDIVVVKEWFVDKILTHHVNKLEQISNKTTEEVNELGMIPAVCAYSARSTVRGVGISQIADIADAQRFIYNCTSEVFESIRLDSHPSLVVTADVDVGTGAGALIKMPDSMDPNLRPYVLDFNGAGIESIYRSIEHTIASIDKMSNMGAVRATQSKELSGVAMQTEFQLLNAKLSEMADNLELAEEQMWKIYCMYQNVQYNMTIEYPGSFNVRDTDSEISQLQKAKSAATSPVVLASIDAQILDWMDLDDDEKLTVEQLMNTQEPILNPEDVSTETEDLSEDVVD